MSASPTQQKLGAAGQPRQGIDDIGLKTKVAEVLDRWPSAGPAAGVVRGGTLEWFLGHGVANIDSKEPITQDTVFRIGSLTKTFTAIAVMQLQEQGLVDLDAPASDYLRSVRLVPAKASFQPATVRHLLTHTAGIGYWRRLLRSCFARTQTWLQAGKYLNALVSDLPSRNGWSVAEHGRDRSPDRSQRLLNRASWDERTAMSQVRKYAAAGLEDAARRSRRRRMTVGALDETGQAKQGSAPVI